MSTLLVFETCLYVYIALAIPSVIVLISGGIALLVAWYVFSCLTRKAIGEVLVAINDRRRRRWLKNRVSDIFNYWTEIHRLLKILPDSLSVTQDLVVTNDLETVAYDLEHIREKIPEEHARIKLLLENLDHNPASDGIPLLGPYTILNQLHNWSLRLREAEEWIAEHPECLPISHTGQALPGANLSSRQRQKQRARIQAAKDVRNWKKE